MLGLFLLQSPLRPSRVAFEQHLRWLLEQLLVPDPLEPLPLGLPLEQPLEQPLGPLLESVEESCHY